MTVSPRLARVTRDGVSFWTDPSIEDEGLVIGFSERAGGVSTPPFASLNLAAHVHDDPGAVDENRTRLLVSAGLGGFRDRLTMAEQVHGERVVIVGPKEAGAGARAATGVAPIAATDALVTSIPGVPIALCFADCVPVVLVSAGPAVAVVHAGWRGALASLPGRAAGILAATAGCETSGVRAYVGPHIGDCHYEVGPDIMSQFVYKFGTFARAESGGLNLDAVVSASLVDSGVSTCNIARLGMCTAEATDRFFSHRAEAGCTGRHAAFACIMPGASSL